MPISIRMLGDKLEHYSPQSIVHCAETQFVKTFKILNKGQKSFEPDILYICKDTGALKEAAELSPVNLLCFAEVPDMEMASFQSMGTNLLLLASVTDKAEFFEELHNIFIERQEIAEGALRLMDMLSKGSSIEQLVTLGYEIIGNPFAVIDSSRNLVAIIKTPEAEDDPQWHELSTRGYSSSDFINYYAKVEKLYKKITENDEPFFWMDKRIKYRRIMGKVKVNDKFAALVGVIEYNKPFKESDIEMVSVLCKALSTEMQKDKFIHYAKGVMYEGFLRDLLDGKIIDSHIIHDRIKYIRLDLKKNIFVLTVDITQFDSTRYTLSFVRNTLEDMIYGSKAIIYNDYVVALISSDNIKNFFESTIPRIKKYLTSNKMRGGMSRSFSNLEELKDYYAQSLIALQLGAGSGNDSPLYFYEDYTIDYFVSLCEKHSSISMSCHPALFALMEYDRQNNTSFTRTLYYYVAYLRNIVDTANACKLHRNTMNYRIQKIEEILNVDLSDNKLLINFYLSFTLLKYKKLIEF